MDNISSLSDERLSALADELAAERTRIREAQVEVQAELDIRAAVNAMPANARRIVKLRLEGGVAPSGEMTEVLS